MKPHLEERNQKLRRDYKILLRSMKWQEAVREISKKYHVTVSTASAIVFHQGYYGR